MMVSKLEIELLAAIDGANAGPEPYLKYGRLLLREKRFPEALRLTEKAITSNFPPAAVRDLQDQRGRAAAGSNQMQLAADAFRYAVAIDPGHEPAQLGLADTLVRQNQHQAAIDALRSAVSHLPRSVPLLTRLATQLRDRGQFAASEDAFRLALKLEPDSAELNADLGHVLTNAGNHAAAEGAYRRALEIAPAEPAHYASLGRSLQQTGRSADAIEVFEKGLSLAPPDPRIAARLAASLRAIGDAGQSRSVIQSWIDSDQNRVLLHPELIDEIVLYHGGVASFWSATCTLEEKRVAGHARDLIAKVKDALSFALLGDSQLDPAVLEIRGMSGTTYRRLINNLIRSLPDAHYLEVGSWAGSTLCSAINRNDVRAVAIDNWSLFGGPKDEFNANVARFKSQADVTFIESDFRAVDYCKLGNFNVYLFDGPHSRQDQLDGMRIARPALDQYCVIIVDDWNWRAVREGTFEGLKLAQLQPLFSIEVRTTMDNTHAQPHGKDSTWHNGYFICVAEKL